MQDIASHWRNHYDWRRTEARINRWPQYIAAIDGLDFHVLHARSSHAHALPLVMTHGWPGSIVEFLEVIEPLTEPQRHGGDARDAFHVVCPSLPGYGFSAKPAAPGWGVERIARAWAALMAQLGYQRYVAQGGDWGAAVTTALAPIDPDHCAGARSAP
jgi:pimeloyl-ACP methyl ester carboxylesterase